MENDYKSGHRKRVKQRYIKSGMDGMPMHNVLELILFYSIKRSDTKPVASAIAKHFGFDYGKLFSAEKEELMSIDGVGEKTAELIMFFGKMINKNVLFSNEKTSEHIENSIPELMFLKSFAADYYKDSQKSSMEIMFLDSDFSIISVESFKMAKSNRLNGEIRDIIKSAIIKKSVYLALMFYHKDGGLFPTDKEIEFIKGFNSVCRNANLYFYDAIIVDGSGTFSVSSDYRTCFTID